MCNADLTTFCLTCVFGLQNKQYLRIDIVHRFWSRDLEETDCQCRSLLSISIVYQQAPILHISWTPEVRDKTYPEDRQLPAMFNPHSALRSNNKESGRWEDQNFNWFRSETQCYQTLWATSPILLSTSSCSQTPLEETKVLSHCKGTYTCARLLGHTYGDWVDHGCKRGLEWLQV
jgi:hypothetical protein